MSDWGFDFRPDYQRLTRTLLALAPGTPVLATTATANARVTADVAAQLGDGTVTLRGSLARTSLRLAVVPGLDGVATGRVGRRRPRPAARLGHRLRAHRRRDRAASPACCASRGLRRRRLLVGRRHGRAGSPRGPAAAQRGQGPRRHVGARHGLRQARPGVLHPRRLAGVAGRLLPAGRPRRTGARRRRRRAAAVGRRRADLGVLRHGGHPRARARRRACSAHSPTGATSVPAIEIGDEAAPRPHRGAAQDPRRRRRRRQRVPTGGRPPGRRGCTTPRSGERCGACGRPRPT